MTEKTLHPRTSAQSLYELGFSRETTNKDAYETVGAGKLFDLCRAGQWARSFQVELMLQGPHNGLS